MASGDGAMLRQDQMNRVDYVRDMEPQITNRLICELKGNVSHQDQAKQVKVKNPTAASSITLRVNFTMLN